MTIFKHRCGVVFDLGSEWEGRPRWKAYAVPSVKLPAHKRKLVGVLSWLGVGLIFYALPEGWGVE